MNDEDFLEQLRETFKVEAEEHLYAMSVGITALESAQPPERRREIFEAALREAHSLKGAARAVSLTSIETLCQTMEQVLGILRQRESDLAVEVTNTLHYAVDSMAKCVSAGEKKPADLGGIIQRLTDLEQRPEHDDGVVSGEVSTATPTASDSLVSPAERPSTPQPDSEAPVLSPTVRIDTATLESLLAQAEELVAAKISARQRVADSREGMTLLDRWKKDSGNHALADSARFHLTTLVTSLEQDCRSLDGYVDGLLEDAKQCLMLPASYLLETFPRLVRDLSRSKGKEVELVIEGGDVRVDKRILEEMKDPLIHLVRNSLDHGIEPTEQRSATGKPDKGRVKIAIGAENGSEVQVLVSDDGRGIDVDAVRAAALKRARLSPENDDSFAESDPISLIFRSGVSTSPIITDISGRGLGLAIVREKVDRLGGRLSVESEQGAGTTFRLLLPLTLATFRGVLVRAEGRVVAIPLTHVARVARVASSGIKTVESRETITLGGRVVSLVRLADVLRFPRGKESLRRSDTVHVVVLSGVSAHPIAVAVDEILHEQEVLVKSLGSQLSGVTNVAGATVLGSGVVVPILSVRDFVTFAFQDTVAAARESGAEAPDEQVAPSLLVVEDSITSRTLLTNILQTAGYRVTTAVDGSDGYAALRADPFDLVVTDIEMPKMDGFELVSKIRADSALSELPVVLVTSRESREDHERGAEVGANAYIVKSRFDHANLLDIIRQLV